ncbi:DUF4912 domain-containing protein [Fodinisporobacter ferrooxydans]|uniref:DUF4912 domain-containing protein n=1 Tax=Fodinisporobacter ferrooxydans TaxID=2901836 RepID=A0ABY4CJT7_9BACL|nr:DUF4912 domain-containing protein [Alicyclobacillaceae bacterium MYW30-H2]
MEDTMLKRILEMLEQGYKYSDIVRETGLSYGKIRYRIRKHGNPHVSAAIQEEEDKISYKQENQQAHQRNIYEEHWTRERKKSGIFAVAKDSTTIFAYWFVKEDRRIWAEQFFQMNWYDIPVFLRVYDVTDIEFNGYNAHHTNEIPVHHHTDNWYIHNLQPGRNYIIDYGFRAPEQEFLTLLRSNCVSTPNVRTERYAQPGLRFQAIHS